MSQEKPTTYTAEFRASAVKLANESDQSVAQTAKDLGINVNTLHTWIGKYSRPKESDKTVRTDEHLYEELKRLKKENARLIEERDLLKNRLPGSPTPYAKKQVVPYTHLTRGHWPTAFWRLNPRQKTWPMGSCGPNCGGTSSDPV
jgi:transposase